MAPLHLRTTVLLTVVAVFAGAPTALDAQARRIAPGTAVSGRLEPGDQRLGDSTFADDYVFDATGDERVVVTLRSRDFDAFLQVARVDGGRSVEVGTDDDGGGGSDARFAFTVRAGRYVIRANSLRPATGGYTLLLESSATQPIGDGNCEAMRDWKEDALRATTRPQAERWVQCMTTGMTRVMEEPRSLAGDWRLMQPDIPRGRYVLVVIGDPGIAQIQFALDGPARPENAVFGRPGHVLYVPMTLIGGAYDLRLRVDSRNREERVRVQLYRVP